jgi:hypothetical protein
MMSAGKSPLMAAGFAASSVLTGARCFELGWIECIKDSRAVTITGSGRRGLLATFSVAISNDRNNTRAEG